MRCFHWLFFKIGHQARCETIGSKVSCGRVMEISRQHLSQINDDPLSIQQNMTILNAASKRGSFRCELARRSKSVASIRKTCPTRPSLRVKSSRTHCVQLTNNLDLIEPSEKFFAFVQPSIDCLVGIDIGQLDGGFWYNHEFPDAVLVVRIN